jgi:single-strand DNA-binding protein
MYMNRVTLCGFVGADAKHSAPQGGKEITRFSLATKKRFKDGDEKDRTQWHYCLVYWNTVKFADNALRKGSHLLIEGNSRTASMIEHRDRQRPGQREVASCGDHRPVRRRTKSPQKRSGRRISGAGRL